MRGKRGMLHQSDKEIYHFPPNSRLAGSFSLYYWYVCLQLHINYLLSSGRPQKSLCDDGDANHHLLKAAQTSPTLSFTVFRFGNFCRWDPPDLEACARQLLPPRVRIFPVAIPASELGNLEISSVVEGAGAASGKPPTGPP